MIVCPMTDPLGDDNIREYLTAFADGELDADQILAVLDYIKTNPQSLDLMVEQQRLRLAAMRTVRQSVPPAPRELHDRIRAMAAVRAMTPISPTYAAAASPTSATTSDPRARKSFWPLALAAAVVLCAGMALTYLPQRSRPGQQSTATTREHRNVPVSLVAAVTGVHVDCSRFAARLHPGEFPKELGELPAAVQLDFSRDVPYPDLSAMGYRFIDAGRCSKPLHNTAHLVYESTRKNMTDKVSIFVQPYSGQPALEAGKFYLVSDATSPHPMFAWRTQRAVYYLVADDMQVAEQARTHVASALTP